MASLTQSRFLLVVIVVVVILALAAAVPALSQQVERPENANVSPPNSTIAAPATQTAAEPRQYTVVATATDHIDIEALKAYGTVGTQVGAHVELTMMPDRVPAVRNLSYVSAVYLAQSVEPTAVAGPNTTDTLGVSNLHKRGITGSNVTVGVIDGGFDVTDPAIADNVADTQQFAAAGPTYHGTTAAATVVKTAPDVRLSLATIRTATDYAAALQYFRERDVDIVVASLTVPGFDDDGDHPLTNSVDQTRANGTLVVNSAGNDRQRHWQGNFTDANNDSIHEFSPGDESLCVPNCGAAFSGPLNVLLHWDADNDGSSYRIYLYNPVRETFLVGSETVTSEPDEDLERIIADVPPQPIDLVVEHTGGPTDDELEALVYGARTIEDPVARSSVTPPADVPAALSVAAYVRSDEQIAPYSSVGPNDAGEAVVDVAGYTNVRVRNTTFTGTSAAAPQVAGVAALAADAGGADVTADKLVAALDTTAVDVGSAGYDDESGAGVVNATAAVTRLTGNETDTGVAFQGTRTIGENPAPDGTVIVTTNVTVANESANLVLSERFDPTVGGSKIESVQIDGRPVAFTDLAVSAADKTGVTVIVLASALDEGANVTVDYEVTAPKTNGTTVTVAGTAANGPDASTEISGDTQFQVVVSPLEGVAGTFDNNRDGQITANELGNAGTAFAQGNLTASELGDVATAFARS